MPKAKRNSEPSSSTPYHRNNEETIFIIKSQQYYRPDGFHSYQEPPRPTVHGQRTSLIEANRFAEKVFFEKNPWGLDRDEIEEHDDVEITKSERGLKTYLVSPPDSEIWKVWCEAVYPSTQGRFIVSTSCGYPHDGFHSYTEPEIKTEKKLFSTKAEANAHVRKVFVDKNPYGFDKQEIMKKAQETLHDGLLTLEVHPDDSEIWSVYAETV